MKQTQPRDNNFLPINSQGFYENIINNRKFKNKKNQLGKKNIKMKRKQNIQVVCSEEIIGQK